MSAIDQIQAEIDRKRAEVQALENALAVLTGGDVALIVDSRPSARKDFEGISIVDAAKRLMREKGRGLTTREIADTVQARGLTTRSKNFTATVYATLDNSKAFKRTNEGNWEPKDGLTEE